MNAETCYLFRHALIRDAAYQLQLPGDRAALHARAFEAIEALAGGRPPEPPPLNCAERPAFRPRPADVFAEELVAHLLHSGASAARQGGAFALYLRRAAEAADAALRLDAGCAFWKQLAEISGESDRAEALRRAGLGAYAIGWTEEAVELLQQALELFRRCGDRRREGVTLGDLAARHKAAGRIRESEGMLQQAIEIHRGTGNRRSEGIDLAALAVLYEETGRRAEAETHFDRALAILRDVGDRRNLAATLANVASLYRQTGRLELSERTYLETLAYFRESGDLRSEGVILGSLASLYAHLGRTELAEQTCEQALAIHRRTGHRRSEGYCLGLRAFLQNARGDIERSLRTYEEALPIYRDVGDRRFEGIALGHIGMLHRSSGRPDLAERCLESALELHRAVRDKPSEGSHGCALALCRLERGKVEEAAALWRDMFAIVVGLRDAAEVERRRADMRAACKKASVAPFDGA